MNNEKVIQNAREIKTLRKTMGLKAYTIAALLGVDQQYYSRMENGFAQNEKALHVVRREYEYWLDLKVVRLQREIDYLNRLKNW